MTTRRRKVERADEVMRSLLEELAEYDNSSQSWLFSLNEREEEKSASDRALSEFRREFSRRIRERARTAG